MVENAGEVSPGSRKILAHKLELATLANSSQGSIDMFEVMHTDATTTPLAHEQTTPLRASSCDYCGIQLHELTGCKSQGSFHDVTQSFDSSHSYLQGETVRCGCDGASSPITWSPKRNTRGISQDTTCSSEDIRHSRRCFRGGICTLVSMHVHVYMTVYIYMYVYYRFAVQRQTNF